MFVNSTSTIVSSLGARDFSTFSWDDRASRAWEIPFLHLIIWFDVTEYHCCSGTEWARGSSAENTTRWCCFVAEYQKEGRGDPIGGFASPGGGCSLVVDTLTHKHYGTSRSSTQTEIIISPALSSPTPTLSAKMQLWLSYHLDGQAIPPTFSTHWVTISSCHGKCSVCQYA